jgi:hypothetical protein
VTYLTSNIVKNMCQFSMKTTTLALILLIENQGIVHPHHLQWFRLMVITIL